jgi:hypothetical protein
MLVFRTYYHVTDTTSGAYDVCSTASWCCTAAVLIGVCFCASACWTQLLEATVICMHLASGPISSLNHSSEDETVYRWTQDC